MLKQASAMLLICVLLFALAGCSSENNSAIVGEWKPSTVSIGGTTISYSELDTNGRDFSFVFNASGSCDITIGGIENEGTYTFNETSVDINYGGKTQKLSYDRGILTLKFDYNGQTTAYMFTKVSQ